MRINISDIWNSQNGIGSNLVKKALVKQFKNVDCFIGTIVCSGARLFSIVIPEDTKINSINLKRFTGVEVQILNITKNSKELTIILMDSELTDIFTLFIEDILKNLNTEVLPEEAVSTISSRIRYWKKLFGKYSTNLLSPEMQKGLFGELLFIKKMIDSGINSEKILGAWKGPNATNQDFYYNSNAVEIKTSSANSPVIRISNEHQLDYTSLDCLFLVFYNLTEVPDKNHSLYNLVESIQSLIADNPETMRLFRQQLIKLNITEDSIEEYNEKGYKVRKETFYHVTEGFPKITSDMLNSSISKVSYEITPDSCTDFITDFDTLTNNFINE